MPVVLLDLSYSLDNINEAANAFWNVAKEYRIHAYSGELGAGKTTLIHALCENLGVSDNVSSPTFALINEYHFVSAGQGKEETIYHMDWYRLKSAEEGINAGMEDCLRQQAYCFVEWPEKAQALLPIPHLWISIKTTEANERNMQVLLHE